MTGTGDSDTDALAMCRSEIARIDRDIVSLLRERVDLALRARQLKQDRGLPILDPPREAQVVRSAVEAARSEGLAEEPVREIFWRILALSRSAQEKEDR